MNKKNYAALEFPSAPNDSTELQENFYSVEKRDRFQGVVVEGAAVGHERKISLTAEKKRIQIASTVF